VVFTTVAIRLGARDIEEIASIVEKLPAPLDGIVNYTT
jgi:hypothetical protein